jgi:endonuclease/exonuclease/phosphatase family metal-dependent hydrolase
MFTKASNIAKVIMAAGEGRPVEIMGFCEVENAKVMQVLLKSNPLSKDDYGWVHFDSNDPRGIDQALIYFKPRVRLLKADTLSFISPEYNTPGRYTLYVKLLVDQLDTLHVMVAHLPSKVGDAQIKNKNRLAAAQVIRNQFDLIIKKNPKANIIVMGDMNDTYDSEPLAQGFQPASIASLKTKSNRAFIPAYTEKFLSPWEEVPFLKPQRKALYNYAEIAQNEKIGTYRYKGKWDVIDHILVSGNLLNNHEPLFCVRDSYTIFDEKFLLEDETKYFGYRPKATYKGSYYNQGTSDHLPVWIDIFKQ